MLVPMIDSLLKHFICPILKINSNTKFVSIVKKRRENENLYISTKAINGKPIDIGGVDLVLYRHDVLAETDENETNNKWELIAFYAIPIVISLKYTNYFKFWVILICLFKSQVIFIIQELVINYNLYKQRMNKDG